MKQVNIALVSAISLMLFSSYGHATTYTYYCKPAIDSGGAECCDSQVTSCGSDTLSFEADSTGTSEGGGKHGLEGLQTKYMHLFCENETYVDWADGVHIWYSGGGDITCTMDGGKKHTLILKCYNWSSKKGHFGLKTLVCN